MGAVVIGEIIRSVDSFVKKDQCLAEISRALLNKRKRSTDANEYIKTLMLNNIYFRITSDFIIDSLKQEITNKNLPTKNDMFGIINNICMYVKNMPQAELLKHANHMYANSIESPDLIDVLEFDYKFASYFDDLLKDAIEYIYEPSCNHIKSHLLSLDPVLFEKHLKQEIYEYSHRFANSTEPIKYVMPMPK